MDPYALKSKEEWQTLLTEINQKLKMVAAITDVKNQVLQVAGDRNRLCATIRDNEKSLQEICMVVQSSMAAEARVLKQPLYENCEAGFFKFLIPLFKNGEWVGSLTACGCLTEDGELETESINLISGLKKEEISKLANSVETVSEKEVKEYVEKLFQQFQT